MILRLVVARDPALKMESVGRTRLRFLLFLVSLCCGCCWIVEAGDTQERENSELEGLLEGIFDFFRDADGPENCAYVCESGKSPTKRPGFAASPNGCGAYGFKIDFNPEFTRCCNQHDMCYGTCLETKVNCDNRFKECLRTVCKNLKSKSEKSKEGCLEMAELMDTVVVDLGCHAFMDSQRKACTCGCSKGQSPTASRAGAPNECPSL